MNTPQTCSRCGRPLRHAAAEGLCPQCMLLGAAQEVVGQPGPADTTLPTAIVEDKGASIGRYKLLEKLGEGGFGAVWVAEQRRPVRRRVALKIIKLGMDTKQVIARFEAERQALALMDHPNIAKVLDAGATETGRPYFVMELVKGIPITVYCDQEQMSVQDRLDLFIKICYAIQHAHQKGIIHRDIKPSNIMITLHDGVPVPKVIDFGIAKATQQELTEKTVYTQYSQFIGTPAYMSPEQAEMSGLDIDSRSDIYSLGVLLYELLTGSTPFDTEELVQSGLDEMRKIIRERNPVKPSTRLTQSGASPRLATSHSSLATDLDWIVMKCLEKDRSRRYDTANGVAMDIQRHLRNEPVVARPPSAAYRLQMAWKRNRIILSTAALVIVTLLAGAVVSSLLAIREYEARQRESIERGRAVQAERQATAEAEHSRRLSYLSDVGLAHQVYKSGDLARATRLLERYLPGDEEADLRGFEWYYLWSVCRGRSVKALPREGMLEVAFSPDGHTFATGGSDGLIQIWDRESLMRIDAFPIDPDPYKQYRRIDILYAPSGDMLAGLLGSPGRVVSIDVGTGDSWSLAHGSPDNVIQVAFQKDGNTLLTVERDGQLRHWSASTGQPAGKPKQLEKGATWRWAAFSSDLRLLAAGGPKTLRGQAGSSQSKKAQIKVYDLETGEVISAIDTDTTTLGKLQFTQDGRFLINPGKQLVAWEMETGQEVFSRWDIRGHFSAVPISSDQVAIGGPDSIWFLDPAKGAIVDQWHGIPGAVHDLAVSPDGKQLASAAWDGMARLWDLPRKTNPKTVAIDRPTTQHLSFSPSGDMLASADADGVVLREPVSFEAVYRLDGQTQPVFSPAGDILATVAASGSTIHFWNYRSRQPSSLPVSLERHDIKQLAFSRDGKLIGCVTDQDVVIVLQVATRRIRRRFDIPSSAARHQLEAAHYLAFGVNSVEQGLLAIPAGTRTVKLVNLDNGAEKILEGPEAPIWGVTFSSDGSRLASSGNDIFVWNTKTGEEELGIEDKSWATLQVAFSPDGESLLSRAWVWSLSLWDLRSGREKLRLLDINKQTVQSMAFSPDGKQIIAGVNHDHLLVWSAPGVQASSLAEDSGQ